MFIHRNRQGHSLGAALASVMGVTIKANFPDVPLKVYTYGQPRTGDRSYANLIESVVGASNIYRVIRTTGMFFPWHFWTAHL